MKLSKRIAAFGMAVLMAAVSPAAGLPQKVMAADEEAYVITFDKGAHVTSVDVFYTDNYSEADETNVTTAFSRDGDLGTKLKDGNGQINFRVNVEEGYELDTKGIEITPAGGYKNIKGPDDTGTPNIFRITKIKADITIKITPKAVEAGPEDYTDAYHAAFDLTDGHVKVDVFATSFAETPITVDATEAWARNETTGRLDNSGSFYGEAG